MARKGRPRKAGLRDKRDRLLLAPDRGNDRVQERRMLFYGVRKNAEGKMVDVSDDISDAPGQLHALGFFDEHGHEPDLIRDTMRDYGFGYWNRNADKAPKCGKYERASHGKDPFMDTRADLKFEDMLNALVPLRHDRQCLELLVCDYWWGDDLPPFAKALICERLLQLNKTIPPFVEFPTMNDHAILEGALRATFRLIETGLQANFRRAA